MSSERIAELLSQAGELLAAGDLQTARQALLAAMRLDRNHAPTYIELSRLALDDQERRSCLEEALRCDPANSWAAAELAALDVHVSRPLTTLGPSILDPSPDPRSPAPSAVADPLAAPLWSEGLTTRALPFAAAAMAPLDQTGLWSSGMPEASLAPAQLPPLAASETIAPAVDPALAPLNVAPTAGPGLAPTASSTPLLRAAEDAHDLRGLNVAPTAAPTPLRPAHGGPHVPGPANPWALDPPDLYRCPFCAVPRPGTRRCHSCGKKLYVTEYEGRSSSLWVLFSIMLGTTGIRVGLLLLAYGLVSAVEEIFQKNSNIAANEMLRVITSFWVIVVVAYPAVIGIGLLLRSRIAWWIGLVLAVLDALFVLALFLFFALNKSFSLDLLISVLVAFSVVGLFFNITDDIFGRASSLLVQKLIAPDSASAAYTVGLDYSRRDAWFLASLVWQAAIMRKPEAADYRRALGLAYMQLRAFDAAAFEFQTALQLSPHDTKTRELIELLRREHPVQIALPA